MRLSARRSVSAVPPRPRVTSTRRPAQGGLRRSSAWYQQHCPQAPQDPAAPASPPDQQRVFVRLTKATSQMLQLVQPYVTYGAPNLKTIRDLVYKRGYAKVNRQRLPINDNKVIEENLGKYGILSIEDIVHEIATCGPNFKAVTNFLWPSSCRTPTRLQGKKLTHYTEGVNTGDRGEAINAIVRRMN